MGCVFSPFLFPGSNCGVGAGKLGLGCCRRRASTTLKKRRAKQLDSLLSHRGLKVLRPSHGVLLPAVYITSVNNPHPDNPWFEPERCEERPPEATEWASKVYERSPELQVARAERESVEPRTKFYGTHRRQVLRLQAEAICAGKQRRHVLIMFTHSNSETLAIKLLWLSNLQQELDGTELPSGEILQCSVFSFEYRGFSVAASKCLPCTSESSVYADVEAAYACVTETLGVPSSEVIVFGRSIGSGPAVELGHRHRDELGGLILESPFLSAFRVVNDKMARNCLCCFDVFKNANKVNDLQFPILFIHGTEDRIVPFEHSLLLHSMAQKEYDPFWVKGAGHNDVAERREYFERQFREARQKQEEGDFEGHVEVDVWSQMQKSEREYFDVLSNFASHVAGMPHQPNAEKAPLLIQTSEAEVHMNRAAGAEIEDGDIDEDDKDSVDGVLPGVVNRPSSSGEIAMAMVGAKTNPVGLEVGYESPSHLIPNVDDENAPGSDAQGGA